MQYAEGSTATLESLSVQPETVVTARKRKKAAPAALIHGHEESACVFHQTLEWPSFAQHPHLQSVAVLEASSAGLETDTDPISHSEANSSGLKQARDKKRSTSEVGKRRAQLLDHHDDLVEKASDWLPLCVRVLYDSFQKAVGATTEDMPLANIKFVLRDICNNANGVEYLIFKKQN